jgi:hypothetical protein
MNLEQLVQLVKILRANVCQTDDSDNVVVNLSSAAARSEQTTVVTLYFGTCRRILRQSALVLAGPERISCTNSRTKTSKYSCRLCKQVNLLFVRLLWEPVNEYFFSLLPQPS